MRIRNVRPGDAAALAAIYAPYVRNTAISFAYEAPPAEGFAAQIARVTERYPWLVLEEQDGTVAGYCYASSFHSREAYRFGAELSIYIRMDARARGYGTALYDALEKCLRAMHVLKVYACIAVSENPVGTRVGKASLLFHEKRGYTLVGRFPESGYKFGEWYDMVYMEKDLTPVPDEPEELVPFCETQLYRELG